MSLSALAGFAVAIACVLLLALHRRLGDLPRTLTALVRSERAQDGTRLLDTMKEAVARKSGQAVIAVQTYQEQMAQSLRAQIAEAETRARVAERRASEAGIALEAASGLVRDVRGLLEESTTLARALLALQAPGATPGPKRAETHPPAPFVAGDADDPERKTTEMTSPPAALVSMERPPASGRVPRLAEEGGFDDEDERTRVADRPAALAAALGRGRCSPTVLPPAPGNEVTRRGATIFDAGTLWHGRDGRDGGDDAA